MLPKRFRLKINEFYHNLVPARKFLLPEFIIFSKSSNKLVPRFAVTVSKSLDKRSSARNRTRRIIIEAVRKQIGDIKQAKDVLIRARKILDKTKKELVEKEIVRGFKEISLL